MRRALAIIAAALAALAFYAWRTPASWAALQHGQVFDPSDAALGNCTGTVKTGGCTMRKLFVTHILSGVTDGDPIDTAQHRWRIDLPFLGTYLSTPRTLVGKPE